MSITTFHHGEQAYTALVIDNETGQKTICTYNSSAILTTDMDSLIQYIRNLALHFGKSHTYSIAMVKEMHQIGIPHHTGTDNTSI